MPFPLALLTDAVGKVLDRVLPDPKAKAEALLELEKLQQSGDLAAIAGQVEINKIEAANTNLFIAGWRPAVGWTCCAGLAMQFVVGPFATWGAGLLGHALTFPKLDTDVLLTLLAGLLGLGGLRTYEKLNNAENRR